MACIRRVALIVNCGYARVSIDENSNPGLTGQHARKTIDVSRRMKRFKDQFSTHPDYGIHSSYFDETGKDHCTPFDRDCKKVLDGFSSKFRSDIGVSRESYVAQFSSIKWHELPNAEKSKHTLGNCNRCYELHEDYQRSFPLKPMYEPQTPVVTIDPGALQSQGVQKFTLNVLRELDRVFTNEASTSFTDALVRTKSLRLDRRKTKTEKRKEKRQIEKSITKQVNDFFAEKAAISMLVEGESKRKYHRKRLAQSFCSPGEEQPAQKRQKHHSPNFEHVSWDTARLESTLRNWPVGSNINWTAVARNHGIQGGNAGQVAKEFAEAHAITTMTTPTRKPTQRPCKKRLPGSFVSIPSNPPIGMVEAEIKTMLTSGRFTLGEECTPYKVTKYVPINGVLTPQDTLVHARKVPLRQLREKLLQNQEKYMRLTPTNTSRSLCMWHDHATILKMGFVMVTVHVMYDSTVFYTDEEYSQLHPGANVSVQSEVEQPQIHILSAGSSTVEDQAAIVGDRLSCIADLQTPITASDGTEIKDTLRFFTGDHPATQFEQGTKQGGTYKCGVCGCKEFMFDDQAHSLSHGWRTPGDLQTIATAGTFGKQAGVLQPFDLRVNQLKSELEARGIAFTKEMLRADLQDLLTEALRGVARVPALLITNPTQDLAAMNLEAYEIVASEPLHDIKGHIINVITELPPILPTGHTTSQCTHLISCALSKEKKSGADLRRTVIQIYLLLKDLECSSKVLLLLQTLIKIGEISYSMDEDRSPRQLLQLYNVCWIHMELCRDLLSQPQKLSRSKMFGHYLHAITAHSPTQYELASLRSLNTENQERLFGQARTIAEACTNHHLENVIPQVMLRLQAKQEQRQALLSVGKSDSQVSHIAKELPPLPGTTVKTSFISKREDSWQLHLKQISPFLVGGEGEWWTHTPNGFHFKDGDNDQAERGTFTLLQHRHHTVKDVEERRTTCWDKIIQDRIYIPTNSIKIYNQQGESIGKLEYSSHTVTFQPLPAGAFQVPFNDPSDLDDHGGSFDYLDADGDAGAASLGAGIGDVGAASLGVGDGDAGAASLGAGIGDVGAASLGAGIGDVGAASLGAGIGDVGAASLGAGIGDVGAASLGVGDGDVGAACLGVGDGEVGAASLGVGDGDVGAASLGVGDGDVGAASLGVGDGDVSSYIHITIEEIDGGMKTSLCNNVKKIMECDEDLTTFDEIRFKIKEASKVRKKPSNVMISRYQKLAASLGSKVVAKEI